MQKMQKNKLLECFQAIVNAEKNGDIRAALQAVERGLVLDPDHYQVLFLGVGFAITLSKPDQARGWLERLLALRPADRELAKLCYNLAAAMLDQGAVDDAVKWFSKAAGIDPGMEKAFFYQGIALEHQGDMKGALKAFRTALDIKPDYVEAWRKLSEHKTFTEQDDDIRAMESLLANGEMEDDKALHIHFALYKACQDQARFDQAFQHLEVANAFKHALLDYNVGRDVNYMERVIATFNRDLLDRFMGHGAVSDTPVFIVGMPRSGSTLIEQILSRHPQCFAGGEIGILEKQLIEFGAGRAGGMAFPEYMRDLDAGDLVTLGAGYVDELVSRTEKAGRITNKTPANFIYIGLILLALPGAQIIHSVRHPVATGFSCYQRLFHDGGPGFAYDLEDIATYIQAYRRIMAHWQQLFPGRILHVRYEDVVDDLPREAKRIVDFCGLDWHPDCLDFHRSDRAVMTASNQQVRKPLYTRSVEFWKNYQHHLAPLRVLNK